MSRPYIVTNFETTHDGPLLFVQYDEARRPLSALTADKHGGFSEHDFVWCRRDRMLCVHQSGSSGAREVEAHRPYWAAQSITVRENGSDATRLAAPRGDPFQNACDVRAVRCVACDTAMPEYNPCEHLFEDQHGAVTGPGMDDLRAVPDDVLCVVRRLGCARLLLAELQRMMNRSPPKRWSGKVARLVRHDRHRIGTVSTPWRVWCMLRALQNADGALWLAGLDVCTVNANQILRDALVRELDAQRARRGGDAKEYRVWAAPHPSDGMAEWVPPIRAGRHMDMDGLTPHTPYVCWRDALSRTRELRAVDVLRTVKIRHKAPTAEKPR